MLRQPSLGAWPERGGTRFRVWAPARQTVELVFHDAALGAQAMGKDSEGYWAAWVAEARPGMRYRYLLDGTGPYPDPVSRFQPLGVHGPSEIVDPSSFRWTDDGWRGVPLEQLVVYELHLGTFTPEGTYAAAIEKLPHLAALGITAVELMPLADFPGKRGWSYDGVDLFAPARCYGRPDDLRRFIDAAHRLDVVYNHLGPDGNYLGHFNPNYFGGGTEWGEGPNFAGAHHEHVRQFFVENALYWLNEYHFDGLRIDATHVIPDAGPRPFLAEFNERVKAGTPRPVLLIAEDFRNLDTLLRPAAEGGWGLDGVWADDFHHEVRRFLSGDHEGHYRDYTGTIADLATTMKQGWFYTGQWSLHGQKPRGADPAGIPHRRFVWCIQNHDQIGNRALGERLNHQVEPAAYRAATALLLAAPATPLLFMGQEWAATSPFLFFTDHHAELGKLVTEGRRKEFRSFEAFHNAGAAARIPDPQAEATFQASKLKWEELQRPEHAAMLRYYQALLRLRREWGDGDEAYRVRALNEETLAMSRVHGKRTWTTVVRLRGSGRVVLDAELLPPGRPVVVLTSEDSPFCADSQPPETDLETAAFTFKRPGAILVQVKSD
jgi:maltooligosyltrehalose trehalohydrolase